MFITFEGGEGAGKTTQIALLNEALRRAGRDTIVTREPGGCPEAEALRELLLHRRDLNFDTLNQALLMTAARRAHYLSVIKPALDRKQIVLCDRFFDSTVAYQGYGSAEGQIPAIKKLHELAVFNAEPDLTFLLDIDVDKGLARARGRGAADKMEDMHLDFHHNLRRGYLEIANGSERIHKLDADRAPEDIQADIQTIIEQRLEIAL